MSTDRIEKKVFLKASRSRVWSALADAKKFGTWFRATLEGDFTPGETVHGRILYPGYEHLRLTLVTARVEPETHFSFRWHPYAIDPAVDYSKEPMTLVEFTLEDSVEDGKAGILLTIVESGFDALPASRRAEAFRMNEGGWKAQAENIAKYVAQ